MREFLKTDVFILFDSDEGNKPLMHDCCPHMIKWTFMACGAHKIHLFAVNI